MAKIKQESWILFYFFILFLNSVAVGSVTTYCFLACLFTTSFIFFIVKVFQKDPHIYNRKIVFLH